MRKSKKRKSVPQSLDGQLQKQKALKESEQEGKEEKESVDFEIQDFLCPITTVVMEDPVVAADGHSYERTALEEWFRSAPFPIKSPMTNQPLEHHRLHSNIVLRRAIQNYRREAKAIEETYQQLEEEKRRLKALTATSQEAVAGLGKEMAEVDEKKTDLEKELQALSEKNQETAQNYQAELVALTDKITGLYDQLQAGILSIADKELKLERDGWRRKMDIESKKFEKHKITPGFSTVFDNKPTLYGELDGQPCAFIEHKAQEDGSCGFHVLGASRDEVVKELLRDMDEKPVAEENCNFLAEEIETALRSTVGGSIHIPESLKLAAELQQERQAYDNTVKRINAELASLDPTFQSLSAEELRFHLTTVPEQKSRLEQLKKAKQQLDQVVADNDLKLRTLCRTQETYKSYVEKYLGGIAWLGYRSAIIFCRRKSYSLYILHRVAPHSHRLELADHHVAVHPVNTIYMLHTQGFSHFNLLEKSSQLISPTLLPPSAHDLLSGTVNLLAEISALELEKTLMRQDSAANQIAQFYLSYRMKKLKTEEQKSQSELTRVQHSFQTHEEEIKQAIENKDYVKAGILAPLMTEEQKQLHQIPREVDLIKQKWLAKAPRQQLFAKGVSQLKALFLKNQQNIWNLLEIFEQKELKKGVGKENSGQALVAHSTTKPKFHDGVSASLFVAVEKGDLKAVQGFIQEGSSINATHNGETLLMLAVKAGQEEVVDYFIVSGADLSTRDKEADLLQVAIFYSHYNPKVVERLLKAGLKFSSPLMEAAYRGNLSKLQEEIKLIKESADTQGCTALHYAAAAGQEKTVIWLVEKGLKTSIREKIMNFTPLLLACSGGHLSVAQWLLEKGGASIQEKDKAGNTALLVSAIGGHLALVCWLLDTRHASVEERNREGDTALTLAAYDGHLHVVKSLIQKYHVSAKEQGAGRYTALLVASFAGHLSVAQWLLQRGGATLEEKGVDNITPLLLAATGGHLPVVQWLLQHGASIQEKDKNGNTALLLAAYNGFLPIVEWLLIENGALIEEKNAYSYTALLLSAENGHLPVVQWIVKRHPKSFKEVEKFNCNALLLAAINGHLAVVQFLQKTYPSLVKARNKYSNTALLLAAFNGRLSVVQWLLEYGGSSLKEKNEYGYTALLCAAMKGDLITVKWLWEKSDVPLDEKDKDGDSALLWAVYNNHLPVVEWLIEKEKYLLDKRYASDSSRIFKILIRIIKKGQIKAVIYFLGKTKELKEKFLKRFKSYSKSKNKKRNRDYYQEPKRNNRYLRQVIDKLTKPMPKKIKRIQIEEEPEEKNFFNRTSEFICPLSHQIMSDPIIACDEHSYEREKFEEWILNHNVSPVTKLRLISFNFTPNYTLKKAISSYQAQFEKMETWQKHIADLQEETLRLSDSYQAANYQQRLRLKEKQHAKESLQQQIDAARRAAEEQKKEHAKVKQELEATYKKLHNITQKLETRKQLKLTPALDKENEKALQEIYQIEKELCQLQQETITQQALQMEYTNYVHHQGELSEVKQGIKAAVDKDDFLQAGRLVKKAEELQHSHTQLTTTFAATHTTGETELEKTKESVKAKTGQLAVLSDKRCSLFVSVRKCAGRYLPAPEISARGGSIKRL